MNDIFFKYAKIDKFLRTSKNTKNVEFLNYLSFFYIYHQIPKFNVHLTFTKFTHLNQLFELDS
jgi:hypothetical protein